ncbi:MAG TPA: hypothetical protein VN956_19740 [Pyrinomonadaceae bacterium]|nr:hypothetical protein [Pyrinomonadaceae bacterium]
MQPTFAMCRSKNGERFTFKWMVRTNNGDSLGQVLVMGSVSRFPLIKFPMTGFWRMPLWTAPFSNNG